MLHGGGNAPLTQEGRRLSSTEMGSSHMAVGQNQWYHFGAGAPPILVYFSGDSLGYGVLTHGHIGP